MSSKDEKYSGYISMDHEEVLKENWDLRQKTKHPGNLSDTVPTSDDLPVCPRCERPVEYLDEVQSVKFDELIYRWCVDCKAAYEED